MKEIRKYQGADGKIPFDDWMDNLRDRRAIARMSLRIRRLSLGLEGDWKSVGQGVREIRIPIGKGYRVYYAWDGDAVIILLCGGNKPTQNIDIRDALNYWRDYKDGK